MQSLSGSRWTTTRKEIEYGMTKCDVLKISDNEVEFLFNHRL